MRSAVVRLAALLVVAGVIGAAWALSGGDGDAPEAEPPRTRLYAAPQDAIVSVAVRTPAAAAAFERSGSAWRFADDGVTPVNPDRWGGVVLLLSGPDVERRLPPPGDPAEFGLDAPSVISIGLADGSRVGVRLGAPTPDGRNVYAQLDGEQGIALVNEPWARVLLRLADDPPLPYWRYSVAPALVRLFEVEADGGVVTFLLGLPDAGGEPSYRVVSGGAARPLTRGERDAALAIAGGPAAFGAAAWPDGLTAEGAGLDAPRAVIRVTYELAVPLEDRSAVSVAYAIGAPTPDGVAVYAATPDTPLLLTFDAAWVRSALSLAEQFGAE